MTVLVLSSSVRRPQGSGGGRDPRTGRKEKDPRALKGPFFIHLDFCISKGPLASH